MNQIFLDTGYMIALETSNDPYHRIAKQHWQSYGGLPPRIVTSTYVMDEIVTFFNRRGQHRKAVEVGTRLLTNSQVRLIHVDAKLFHQGWSYFQRHADKRYSLTDCISFVLMQRESVMHVLGFDHHFTQAGLILVPGD